MAKAAKEAGMAKSAKEVVAIWTDASMVTAQLAQSKLGAAISWLAFEVMLSPRSSCDLWRQN